MTNPANITATDALTTEGGIARFLAETVAACGFIVWVTVGTPEAQLMTEAAARGLARLQCTTGSVNGASVGQRFVVFA